MSFVLAVFALTEAFVAQVDHRNTACPNWNVSVIVPVIGSSTTWPLPVHLVMCRAVRALSDDEIDRSFHQLSLK